MSEIKCIDCGKTFTIGPYHVPLTRCLDCLVKLEERYSGVILEDAALRAENARLRYAIEREIVFCEEEAECGHSAYEATFKERAASLRSALAAPPEGKEENRGK